MKYISIILTLICISASERRNSGDPTTRSHIVYVLLMLFIIYYLSIEEAIECQVRAAI